MADKTIAPETTDVVVIGSGAGGSPVALELARAGMRVVILEKGRAVSTPELNHDEIRMCRRNFFVPYPTDEPHTIRYGQSARAEKTAEGWTANIVGGGTAHYSGFFFRMKPVDMRLRSTLGAIAGASHADWPISYADLEPFYQRAEEELGVSGVWKRHPFEEPRSADYPMPPLPEHPLAARIDSVAEKLGVHPFPTPRAILSRARPGRSACLPCLMCGSYGCPIGAKGSTAAALLPAAVATGHCEIRPRAMAQEITMAKNGRVDGVVYLDEDGQTRRISARCVVVACSAIESARLLLMSRSSRFSNGLANGSKVVGKNLAFSGLARATARFVTRGRSDRAWLASAASPFVQRSIQDFYLLERKRDGVQKTGTLQFLLGHANPIFNAEKIATASGGYALWGQALKDKLREQAGTLSLEAETFCEFLPNPGTYVDLDPDVKDKWGMPVARMTISRHPLDTKATGFLIERGMEVLRALEPDNVALEIHDGETKFLQGGTCRFGNDPASSVLDRNCRAHEVTNLYVCDGSFMPTSSGVPQTLTILANAFRVGEHIRERFVRGDF